jgi:FtsH-binding integral membrane protein
MRLKKEKVKIILFLFLIPIMSLAAEGPLVGIARKILDFLSVIPGFLFGLALTYFFYGLVGYVTARDEKKMKEGRDIIFYGVIGLFVMSSVWGLVSLARSIFNI